MGLQCIQLSKTFYTRQGEVSAVESVDLTIGDEEFVCLVGPSGCGKTTLLKLIAGLLIPNSGEIVFDQQALNGKLHSAMVFQEQGLFPWMTVRDNVAFGLETQGFNQDERRKRAEEFLGVVGLAKFSHSYPYQLSGGMRQRVAILRAFLADPHILLMDEPFGALDSQTRLVMQEELLRIWKEHRKTVIYVTHDIDEAILLADRVIVMSGRPARIRADIHIPLERPRLLTSRDRPDFTEIRWQIWRMLESEVRRELSITA